MIPPVDDELQFVFEDLKPAVKELFTFPAWYAEGTCTIIIETMRDYLADYAELLNPTFFEARLLPLWLGLTDVASSYLFQLVEPHPSARLGS